MALLHVVDPRAEDPADKLRKVESFIDYLNLGALPCISQDSNWPLMSIWSNPDIGLASSSTSKINLQNGASSCGF